MASAIPRKRKRWKYREPTFPLLAAFAIVSVVLMLLGWNPLKWLQTYLASP